MYVIFLHHARLISSSAESVAVQGLALGGVPLALVRPREPVRAVVAPTPRTLEKVKSKDHQILYSKEHMRYKIYLNW